MDFPNKKYSVIYADPPWQYSDKAAAGNRGAEFKYPTMPLRDIAALPVRDIAADNSALFMWITAPLMLEIKPILFMWGFKYKTIAFTWVKRNRKAPSYFMGMGHWTRANAEMCIIATRGRPKRKSASVHSVIDEAIREHSQKPGATRDRIVALMGDVPRIELFARTTAPGWDVWGNQTDKFGGVK